MRQSVNWELKKQWKQLKHLLLFSFLIGLVACGDDATKDESIDPGFADYISGFTSGVISKKSTIRIHLTESSPKFTSEGDQVEVDLFDFSPSIEGETYWLNERTLEFQPSELLKSGTVYTLEFDLAAVLEVESDFKEFECKFQTKNQNLESSIEGIDVYNDEDLIWNQVNGKVQFADFISDQKVESMFQAGLQNEALNISWVHGVNGVSHKFTIDSVQRRDDAQNLLLSWASNDDDFKAEGELEFEVPSLSDFKVMNVTVVNQPEQHMIVHFSDPLDKNQNLKGLVRLKGGHKIKLSVEKNKLKIYPSKRLSGTQEIIFEKGVKNVLGYQLKEKQFYEVPLVEYKPEVKIEGKGVILPSTDGLVFPFKAVNLSAVDVRIIKIFENNVGQFLQENRLSGSSEIKRVGKIVYWKKVKLESDHVVDMGVWNNFHLNLEELIEQEPGAIYRVELSFKKSYSLYNCGDEDGEEAEDSYVDESWDEPSYDEFSYWNYYETDYSDYYWRDRDDPCTPSYFINKGAVSRNILASNIALIAKSGKDRKIRIYANDIRTTKALSGTKISLYTFQNQLIGTKSTDGEGMVEFDLKEKPFLAIADKGGEKAYLKLTDGNALSTSKFNVQGEVVQKGVKGFIYGERGVWRPGDTLFLSFILEDRENLIPDNHPVKLEFYNPLGQLMTQKIAKGGLDGFYTFELLTDDEAETGSWWVNVKVGGLTFTKYLRIENIKPNRLKIKLDFGTDLIKAGKGYVAGDLEAKWLHGAPAKNMKTKISVLVSPRATHFKDFQQYKFDDDSREVQSEEKDLYKGKTDAQGMAFVNGKIKTRGKPAGFLNATFITRVTEPGGDFSTDKYSIPYSPYSTYVGTLFPEGDRRGMLLTDTNHVIDVVRVNEDGKLSEEDAELKVKVYKLRWRWWWQNSSEDIGYYISNSSSRMIQSFNCETTGGKGSFKLRIDYPDWGRYLVRVIDPRSGHSTSQIVYLDWPGWAGRAKRKNADGASILSFTADKDDYKVGEEAVISIPASGKGRALVSVESGSKVIQADWVEVDNTEVLHKIKITKEMAPNVFIHVTMVQPHQHDNDLPIRLYGVVPIEVSDEETILRPKIEMPKELAPLSQFKVKVSEEKGKAMTYTLAVVDEGILGLTRFKTPNPHPVFYAHEALGVKTWDLYDDIVGAYGGKLEGVLSIGGDEGMNKKAKDKAKRFKPMVRYIGPFTLDAGDKNEHIIDVPNYIGEVRTMVVAGKDRAYGRAEVSTPVKKPLMVLASLPRVLGPTEKVKLPVTVFVMDKKVRSVDVTVKLNDKFNGPKTLTQTFEVEAEGEQVVEFDLEVGNQTGKAEVQVIASGAGERSTTEVELQVRNANSRQFKFEEIVVEAGATDTLGMARFGLDGTEQMYLELSNIPAIDLSKRMKYLMGYPHGCVEQTVSRVFPLLNLGKFVELDEKEQTRAKQNVQEAIKRLQKFVSSNGGLTYWPGSSRISDWGTTYALHFLCEAEKKGYTVPNSLKKKLMNFTAQSARNYTTAMSYTSWYGYSTWGKDYSQVYRLYILAKYGEAEVGAMNRLWAKNKLDFVGLYRLAAAYEIIGEKASAKQLVENAGSKSAYSGRYGYCYGSREREDAMMLQCYLDLGMKNKAATQMKKVAKNLGNGRYLNTQAIAYSLLSMSDFLGSSGVDTKMDYVLDINGNKENKMSNSNISKIDFEKVKNYNSIKIKNNGKSVLFARLVGSGIPAPGKEETSSKNIKATVRYKSMTGVSITPDQIAQGTDFYAEISVSNEDLNNAIENVSLVMTVPSGWEIINTRMLGIQESKNYSTPDYMDIKDDKVKLYFDLGDYRRHAKQSKKLFKVRLNAAYLGNYYLPGVAVEAMYDDNYKAATKGKWVEITKGL